MAHGLDPALFWTLTPRELVAIIVGMRRRLRREHNDRMTQAFYTASLPNMKRPPKLKDLLISVDEPKPRRQQSVEEMIAIARQWTAATKGR